MAEKLTCMNCGTAITSGFFCAKCQSGETTNTAGQAKFSGRSKTAKQINVVSASMADLMRRVLILAVIAGVGFGLYKVFQKQIDGAIAGVRAGTAPREKYDPTKDAEVTEDGTGGSGQRAFGKKKNPAAEMEAGE